LLAAEIAERLATPTAVKVVPDVDLAVGVDVMVLGITVDV
jgi:hypothetical protein